MNKEEIKKALKKIDETLIEPTYFEGDDKKSAIFCTYDNIGCVFEYWVDTDFAKARRVMLSSNMLHERNDCSGLFF